MTKKEIIQNFKDQFGSDLDYISHIRNVGKTTVRYEFNCYLDCLCKDGEITNRQYQNTTASDKELFGVSIKL